MTGDISFLETIAPDGVRRYYVARGAVAYRPVRPAAFRELRAACTRLDCFQTVTDRDGTVRHYCEGRRK